MWRIHTVDLWPSPWKIHVKEINFIGKLQGASVFMSSKIELSPQVFLKDIGLRCRKFIIQNRTFADQLSVAAFDVFMYVFIDLFTFVCYWDSHTLSQRSFLKLSISQTTVAYCFFYSQLFGLIIFFMWRSHDIHATSLWMFLDRTTFWSLWMIKWKPHISRCGHTLEINTFIPVKLVSYEKICKLCIHT